MKKILATITLIVFACFMAGATIINNPTVDFNPGNESAFGVLETGELTPVLQMDFIYGINIQVGKTNISGLTGGGNVDTSANRLRVQSGTNTAGFGTFQSVRGAKYRAGQGVTARWTSVFAQPVTNNLQEMGAGNESDGYMFGYFTNGQFGIIYRGWGTNSFIPQTSWNGDKSDGTGKSGFALIPTNGNVYMVKYPFLGYGNIEFFIEDGSAGFVLVHTILYANTSTNTSISNPNLSFWARSINYGSQSNVVMYSGSVGFFLSGPRSFLSNPKWAANSGYLTAATAYETNLITLQNCTNYNGIPNRSLIRLNSMTISTTVTASGAATYFVRYNPNYTIAPTFVAINGTTNLNGLVITNGNSITGISTNNTGISGGQLIFTSCVSGPNNGSQNQLIDLSPYDLYIAPGDKITVSVQAVAGTTISIISLTWTEDI